MIRYLPRVKGKRFTDTGKWEQPWFRRLSTPAKELWHWLNDYCDNAGVIEPDLELASFQIGQPIEEKHVTELAERLERLPDGKLWLHDFIPFQYGKNLSPDCPAHKAIIKLIQSHNLEYPYPNHTLKQQLTNPTSRDGVLLTKSTGNGIKSKEGGVGETKPLKTEFEVLRVANRIIANTDDWHWDNCKVDIARLNPRSLQTVIDPYRETFTQAQILACWTSAVRLAHAAKVDKLAKNPTAYAVQCFKQCLQNKSQPK